MARLSQETVITGFNLPQKFLESFDSATAIEYIIFD